MIVTSLALFQLSLILPHLSSQWFSFVQLSYRKRKPLQRQMGLGTMPGAAFDAVIVLCMIVASLALFWSSLILFVASFSMEPVSTLPHLSLQWFSSTTNLRVELSSPYFVQLSYHKRKPLQRQMGLGARLTVWPWSCKKILLLCSVTCSSTRIEASWLCVVHPNYAS